MVQGADATAGLDKKACFAADRADQVDMGRDAASGGVEVDHMDPGGPGVAKGASHGDRVIVIDRNLVIIALAKADTLATEQVDRRIDDEIRIRHQSSSPPNTQPESSLRPLSPLFSGWNWVSRILSFCTAAANGTPWVQRAAIRAGSAGSQ